MISNEILLVTGLSGQTEVLTKYNNFEMYEELNGNFTLSFSSFPHESNPGYNLIEHESIIEYEGYKFRIKQLRTTTFSKEITAVSIYFDNADKRKYDIFGGTHTFDEFMSYTLANTGWTYINEDISKSVLIPNFGNDNVVKLVDILKQAFVCEMKIEPNNVLRFSTKLGPDSDFQYRYKHNILSISESIDTTQLKTYIEGFGANGLHVTYTSPLASNPIIGIRHAEPIYDNNYSTPESMLEYLKTKLYDRPDSAIELSSIELQEKQIGQSVWLIHEKLGMEYQTRVIVKRTKIPKNLSSVILGNYKPQTFSNILASQKVEIDLNNKITRSRIEQTNETIILEVERLDSDIASVTLEADEIRTEVGFKVSRDEYEQGVTDQQIFAQTKANEARAAAEATAAEKANLAEISANAYADGIVTAEEQRAIDDANAKFLASKAYSDDLVNPINTRLLAAESSITQNADQIALRVTTTTYNTGIADTIAYADGVGESTLSDAQGYTDISLAPIETRVTTAESAIIQNANNIELKVSQTDYTGATMASKISLEPSTIKIAAKNLDLSGIVTITDLETEGATIINAGNITTGIISADRVGGGTLRLLLEGGNYANIYGEQTGYGGTIVLDAAAVMFGSSVIDFTGNQIEGLNVIASFG